MAKYAKKNNTPVIVLTIILLLVAAVLGGMVWFVSSHFFVDGRAYPKNAKALDLRGKTITAETYDTLRARLPQCEIRWDVPFQGSAYPDDTTALTVHSLSDADLARLARFPKLERLDAAGCRDYDRLMQLKQQRPDLVLTYTVDIGGGGAGGFGAGGFVRGPKRVQEQMYEQRRYDPNEFGELSPEQLEWLEKGGDGDER